MVLHAHSSACARHTLGQQSRGATREQSQTKAARAPYEAQLVHLLQRLRRGVASAHGRTGAGTKPQAVRRTAGSTRARSAQHACAPARELCSLGSAAPRSPSARLPAAAAWSTPKASAAAGRLWSAESCASPPLRPAWARAATPAHAAPCPPCCARAVRPEGHLKSGPVSWHVLCAQQATASPTGIAHSNSTSASPSLASSPAAAPSPPRALRIDASTMDRFLRACSRSNLAPVPMGARGGAAPDLDLGPLCSVSIQGGTSHPDARITFAMARSCGASSSVKNVTASPVVTPHACMRQQLNKAPSKLAQEATTHPSALRARCGPRGAHTASAMTGSRS